jgi:putative ABC transport system permease protein
LIARLRIFQWLVLRPMRNEPVRTGLTILAVALGVGVVLAIDLAGTAAAGSFRSSVESLAGDADIEITATGGVPDQVAGILATLPYDLGVRPRIEDFATVVASGRSVPVIGIDLVSNGGAEAPRRLKPAPPDTSAVWLPAAFGFHEGQTVALQIGDRIHDYTVAGVVDAEAVVMDIATAARDLRRGDRVDSILVKTPSQPDVQEWIHRLQPVLPAGVSVRPQGSRTTENRRMLAAFRWNLRVLSYIALVVGAFLIYNTISVSVVRRRPEIGIARALGATRSGVLLAFLGEAAVFGIGGAVAGIGLGRFMAEGSVRLISATVESLYVSSRPAPIEVTGSTVALAFVIALVVTVLAALSPALEAARVPPAEAMSRGQREHIAMVHKTRDLVIAAGLGVAGAIAWNLPPAGGKPVFGYAAALLLVGCSAFAIPAMVWAISTATSRALKMVLGVEAMLASRSLAASLRRTSVLVGALSTAIAMMTAVGIMVGSFRETVQIWMDNQLKADLYLRPGGTTSTDRHPTLDPDLPARIAALPGVGAVDAFRAYETTYDGLPATFGAGDTSVALRFGRARFVDGRKPEDVLPELRGRDAAIVSEPFANKHHVRTGDRITLSLGPRKVAFRIAGVYYDYANERGYIIVDRSTMLKYLPDPAASNLAVYLRAGANVDAVRSAIERATAGRRVMINSNSKLKAGAIKVFDRTFAITYALEAVAVVVAVMGIAGALLALVIDRRREFGLLRFLGASTEQIRKLILVEAGLLGLLANIAGLVLGFVLSLLLIFVINKQSFGWTIQFHWPVAVLTSALSIVYAATLLAGLYPARVAVRLNPIEVVHEE